MNGYIVISLSALSAVKRVVANSGGRRVIVSTLTLSEAIRRGYDVSSLLDSSVWIRAFSHRPPKVGGLERYDSEAVMIAQELSAKLITADKKVAEVAKSLGVEVELLEGPLLDLQKGSQYSG